MDAALLIARLIIGLGLAVHGSQKLFGWFGGYGLQGTGGWMESIGFRPGRLFAAAAGLCEFAGGLLTALGLLGGVGPALIVLVMLVAIFTVHVKNGFLSSNNGWELPSLYVAGALALAFGGFGRWSVDAALGLSSLSTPRVEWILLAIAMVLAALNVLMRRPVAPPATT